MHVEKEIIYGVFKFSIIVITLAHTHQPQDFNLFIGVLLPIHNYKVIYSESMTVN